MSYKRIIVAHFSFLFIFNLVFLFYPSSVIAQENVADILDVDTESNMDEDNIKDISEDISEDIHPPIKGDLKEEMDKNEKIDSSSFEDGQIVDSNVIRIVETVEKNNITNMPIIKLDQDIFLFLCGFGDAKLSWTHSIEFFKDHVENIFQPPVFVQDANLSLFLLMKNRWYFGVNYKEKIYDSSVYLGYIDIENNVKKHIRLGNKGIIFANIYPFIKGESSNLAPGISANFQADKWRVDSVIRYDSSKKEKRIFYGKNELVENHSSISSWKKSQYFYIPHSNLFGRTPIVYVKYGEFTEWRILGKDHYSVDSKNNLLILKKSFPYGVAINLFESTEVNNVMQEAKNTFSGTLLDGLLDDDVYLEINGVQYLHLKRYKNVSPFEIASIYLFDNICDRGEAYVVNKNTTEKLNEFEIKLEDLQSFFEENASLGQVYSIKDKLNYKKSIVRYPFFKDNSHIYLPIIEDDEKNTVELVSYFYNPVSDYILPKDIDACNIEVYKNGVTILDFVYDHQTHILHIKNEVSESDKIEIIWSENKKYSDTGVLKIGVGVEYKPIELIRLFLATKYDIGIDKQKKNIINRYAFATGMDFEYRNFKMGSHFGFELFQNTIANILYSYKNHIYMKYEGKEQFSIFSNPTLIINLDFNKKDNLSFKSSLYSSIDVWKVKLQGSLALQDTINNKYIVENAGHNVIIPFSFLYMDEIFFINNNMSLLSRTNTVKFNKYVDIKHLTFVNYDRNVVFQGISSSFSPIIPLTRAGNFFVQFKINMNQKYKENYSIMKNNYGLLWIDSLITSYSEGVYNPILRDEGISFIFSWSRPKEMNYNSGFNIQGFNLDAKLSSYNNLLSKKKDNIFLSLRFPMSYNEIFIIPFWERKASKEFGNKISKSYKDDFYFMFDSLKEEYWFFSTPIIYDLFDKNLLSKMQLSLNNTYFFSNTYGVDISRIISNTIKDIYIPVEFAPSFSRIIKSNNSKLKADENYKIKINIKYASQDIFLPIYSKRVENNIISDELVRNYDFYFIFTTNEFLNFTFNSFHKLCFYKEDDNKIGVENNFKIEVDKFNDSFFIKAWKEKISFVYSYQGNKSLINILFSLFSNMELIDEREEKLTITFFKNVYSKALGYNFIFSHVQKTKIGENGEMKLFADISISSTNRVSVLASFTIGIAGKVEY